MSATCTAYWHQHCSQHIAPEHHISDPTYRCEAAPEHPGPHHNDAAHVMWGGPTHQLADA